MLPTSPFKAVAYGVDDITLGLDMEGPKSVASERCPGLFSIGAERCSAPAAMPLMKGVTIGRVISLVPVE